MVTGILCHPPSLDEIVGAKQEFSDYIKIVIDIENERYTLGGRLHADGEKRLLEEGSRQADLWGGGLDLINGSLDTNAMINTRKGNPSQDILDPKVREKFLAVASNFLKGYVRN